MADEPSRKPRIRVPARTSGPSQSVRRFEKARGGRTTDSFQNFSLNLGLGTNNALSDSTYGFLPVTRDRTLLEWIYRGSWIAGVAVDSIAEDMTRKGIQITSTMDPGAIKALEAAASRYGVWSTFADVIAWGRLYGGALGVIMIEGQDPRTPLDVDRVGRGQFKGLMSFDRWMVEPDLERMVRGPDDDALVPSSYWVVASGSGISFEGMRVHHSRVFRHEGVRLPYWQRTMENMWGISVLERLYDRLVAFDSATNGAAQLVYKSYIRTLAVTSLREIVASGGAQLANLQAYVEIMRRYQGIEGISMIDANDRLEGQSSAGTSFGGISDALLHFGQQISGALGVPLVRLFGQSPAGLNSTGESDFRTYYDGINHRQEKELRKPVERVYRMMARSEGIQLPDDFSFIFAPLWGMKEEEKAQVAVSLVGAVTQAEEAGLISQKIALKELKQASDRTGIFSNITEQDIAQADDQITPPQPEGMPGMPGMPGAAPAGPPASPLPKPESSQGTAGLMGHVPLAAGGGDPKEIGLGANPRNQPASGGSKGPGSPQQTVVPPEERSRSFRVYKGGRGSDQVEPGRLLDFQGVPIYVETHRGERRAPQWPPLAADYGYVRMTSSPEGMGEGLDVFVGPDRKSPLVVVVDQVDPATGKFDEHKVLLGFPDRNSAVRVYHQSYDDAPLRVGAVWTETLDQFKRQMGLVPAAVA